MERRKPVEKKLIDPDRVRKIREGFSWIDRRFIQEGWLERLERDQILLYFFLVAVADKDGLSFYSDSRISSLLKIELAALCRARDRLLDYELVAYAKPLTQVLSLDQQRRSGGLSRLSEIFADFRKQP